MHIFSHSISFVYRVISILWNCYQAVILCVSRICAHTQNSEKPFSAHRKNWCQWTNVKCLAFNFSLLFKIIIDCIIQSVVWSRLLLLLLLLFLVRCDMKKGTFGSRSHLIFSLFILLCFRTSMNNFFPSSSTLKKIMSVFGWSSMILLIQFDQHPKALHSCPFDLAMDASKIWQSSF